MLIGVDASRVSRPRRTGTENYSLHILRHMLALDDHNAYRLYLGSELPADLLGPLSARVSSRVIGLPRLWTQIGLSAEMLRASPDVLFVPSHVLPLVINAPSVVVVYDVGHRFFPRAHTLSEWLYVEWAIRRHVRRATRLLTISQSSKRDLVRLYRADPARIDVAYPAVEDRFRPASASGVAEVRQKYDLGERYILHLGTIKPRKNLPRLIQAFGQADIPGDTRLALGGGVTFGSEPVAQAIAATGLAARIRRLAYVPDADLPALYSGAAAVAIVSLYEGFGMPALEALACGATVVASNRGSLPEIVGAAGLLVDPLQSSAIAHGLERALRSPRDPGLGPQRAAQFRWSDAARVTLHALEQAGGPLARRPLQSPASSAAS